MSTTNGITKRSVRESQAMTILRHLQSKGPISQTEAVELYGCWRLGARIFDLRKAGWKIVSEKKTSGEKNWVAYWLASDIQGSSSEFPPVQGAR